MSATAYYTILHLAFARAGARFDQPPVVGRLACALYERNDTATSYELEADLGCEGSAVRRALLDMYRAGLAEGFGSDGGPRRPGIVSRVTLTTRGRELAEVVAEHVRRERSQRHPTAEAA